MKENLLIPSSSVCNKRSCIRHIIDNPEQYYTLKIKPKMKFGRFQEGDNNTIKLRHLVPPVPLLKSIQREICYHLQAKELPGCMYGSIKESNNILNALQHIGNRFFLTIDLKDFFTNIKSTQVFRIFTANNFSWQESRILTKLTTYNNSLPQGAPSSPVLANLAFAKTALQLQHFMENYEITFTTFLDDLTFSSTKDFKSLIPDLLNIIKSNHFYPHHKKIHYCKNFCEVTGLIVGNGKLRLTTQMQREARKNPRIHAYAAVVDRQYKEYLERRKWV